MKLVTLPTSIPQNVTDEVNRLDAALKLVTDLGFTVTAPKSTSGDVYIHPAVLKLCKVTEFSPPPAAQTEPAQLNLAAE